MPKPLVMLLLAPAVQGCWRQCEPVDETALSTLPDLLSQTGLYSDPATRLVADTAIPYTPNTPLWADGAESSRWISLPPDTQIDSSDPDNWRFAEGTRVWQEVAVDGIALETRLLSHEGPGAGDWVAVSYQWNGDATDATAIPDGAADVGGTTHDIPSAEECVACHGGRVSFLLGVSAVQLVNADPYSLDQLTNAGWIEPLRPISQPSDADTFALGYLHAACSHCHNPERIDIGPRCYTPGGKLDLTLPATILSSVRDSPAYQTGERLLGPGEPDRSKILDVVSERKASSMPPLATEVVDAAAVDTLHDWISGL